MSATPGWRIDDLARRAGVTVDTIRFYRRERLLPPAERVGRAKFYGPEHLDRLRRIRDLQDRRFSLAAIRAFFDAELPGVVEGIFGHDGGPSYDLGELVAATGLPGGLVESLRRVGLLRDPAEFGRDAYDALDLDVLRAVAELRRLDIPDDVIVEVAALYVAGVEAVQARIVRIFTDGGAREWDPEDLRRFQSRAAESAGDLIRRVGRMIEYVHQRSLQRLTLVAMEETAAEAAEEADRAVAGGPGSEADVDVDGAADSPVESPVEGPVESTVDDPPDGGSEPRGSARGNPGTLR